MERARQVLDSMVADFDLYDSWLNACDWDGFLYHALANAAIPPRTQILDHKINNWEEDNNFVRSSTNDAFIGTRDTRSSPFKTMYKLWRYVLYIRDI